MAVVGKLYTAHHEFGAHVVNHHVQADFNHSRASLGHRRGQTTLGAYQKGSESNQRSETSQSQGTFFAAEGCEAIWRTSSCASRLSGSSFKAASTSWRACSGRPREI